MLSEAEEGLVARDPALPGLRTLLDAQAAGAAFRMAPLRPAYIRYKPGVSAVIAYGTGDPEQPWVHARALPPESGKAAKLAAAADIASPSEGAFLFRFGHDPDLPGMGALTDPARQAGALRRVLGDAVTGAGLQPIAYKPGRRFVAKLETSGLTAVIKTHGPEEYQAARRVARRSFDVGDRLVLPRSLGASEGLGIVAHEWIEGVAWDADAPDAIATAHLIGGALAELHRNPAHKLPEHGNAEEAQAAAAQAEAAAMVHPDFAGPAGAAASAVSAGLKAAHYAPALVHGDFDPSQVVIAGDRVALIDLDEVHFGAPETDLASFIVRLGSLEHPAAAALLEGYRSAGGVRPRALNAHIAAAALRRALEPFRRLRPGWPEAVLANLDAAHDWAQRKDDLD